MTFCTWHGLDYDVEHVKLLMSSANRQRKRYVCVQRNARIRCHGGLSEAGPRFADRGIIRKKDSN